MRRLPERLGRGLRFITDIIKQELIPPAGCRRIFLLSDPDMQDRRERSLSLPILFCTFVHDAKVVVSVARLFRCPCRQRRRGVSIRVEPPRGIERQNIGCMRYGWFKWRGAQRSETAGRNADRNDLESGLFRTVKSAFVSSATPFGGLVRISCMATCRCCRQRGSDRCAEGQTFFHGIDVACRTTGGTLCPAVATAAYLISCAL